MTRIYQNPTLSSNAPCLRAFLIGAGHYPNAQARTDDVPQLRDLSSVGPSIRKFASKLIREWQAGLEVPLFSVDLLLCEPGFTMSRWATGGNVDGEAPDGALIDPPTLANVRAALANVLDGGKDSDHLLFMCCGHGISKGDSYFILSDFAEDANDVWSNVVNLTGFCAGLAQKEPRNQWLFLDCCADIPAEILNVLSKIGQPLITPTVSGLVSATRKFGSLSAFKLVSATQGAQALGVANRPSRFCEMLLEAIDRGGATKKNGGKWTVDDIGIAEALESFARRKCSFDEAGLYTFPLPMSADREKRMLFRRLDNEPRSCFVAFSTPRDMIKNAKISIVDVSSGMPVFEQKVPGDEQRIVIELLPRRTYSFTADLNGTSFTEEIFGELPEAEPGRLELK